jgi:hypothetical protein
MVLLATGRPYISTTKKNEVETKTNLLVLFFLSAARPPVRPPSARGSTACPPRILCIHSDRDPLLPPFDSASPPCPHLKPYSLPPPPESICAAAPAHGRHWTRRHPCRLAPVASAVSSPLTQHHRLLFPLPATTGRRQRRSPPT